MRKLILIAAAALLAAAAPPAQRGIADPRAFVAETYRAYQREAESPVEWPAFAYSERLRTLFAAYDRWARRNQDLVGSIDFDWWVNAQDWRISDVAVTAAPSGRGRMIVTAHFTNIDRAETIRFLFMRSRGRWYLDDAVQGSGHGGDGWTLSALLRERP